MFDKYELRGSIWKSRVNSLIGSLFLGACALWAAIFMIELAWGVNPLAKAFASAISNHTMLK
jgi:hypothetical protein